MGFFERLTRSRWALPVAALAGAATFGIGAALGGGAILAGIVKGAVIGGGAFIVQTALAEDPDRREKQDFKQVLRATESPARYVLGETQFAPVIANIVQADAQVAQLASYGLSLNDLRRATRGRPRETHPVLDDIEASDSIFITYALCQHPAEAITGLIVNGVAIDIDEPLRNKGVWDGGFSQFIPSEAFRFIARRNDPVFSFEDLGGLKLHYNLTGDGVLHEDLQRPGVVVRIARRKRTTRRVNTRDARYDTATYDVVYERNYRIQLHTGVIVSFGDALWTEYDRKTVAFQRHKDGDRSVDFGFFASDWEHSTGETLGENYSQEPVEINLGTNPFPVEGRGDGISWVVMEIVNTDYWREEGGVPSNVEFRVQGAKVPSIVTTQEPIFIGGTGFTIGGQLALIDVEKLEYQYTANAASCMRWIMENFLSFPADAYDEENFKEAYKVCERNDYRVNGIFTADQLDDVIRQIAIEMRGGLADIGRLKFYAAEFPSPVIDIAKEDIQSIDRVALETQDGFINRGIATFRNEAIEYQNDTTSQIVPFWASANADPIFSQQFGNLLFVNNYDRAAKTVHYLLNNLYYGTTVDLTLKWDGKTNDFDVFSLVRLEFPEKPGIHNKQYLVQGYNLNSDGTVRATLKEFPDQILREVV